MSSDGEMKMSVKLMICQTIRWLFIRVTGILAFSCRKCLSSFISRNMCRAIAGVLKGSASFFTATVR